MIRQQGDLMSPDVVDETSDGVYIWMSADYSDGRFDAEYVASWLEANDIDKCSVSMDRDIHISRGRVYLSEFVRNGTNSSWDGKPMRDASYKITVPFGSEIA